MAIVYEEARTAGIALGEMPFNAHRSGAVIEYIGHRVGGVGFLADGGRVVGQNKKPEGGTTCVHAV